jgi:hypothetical protein
MAQRGSIPRTVSQYCRFAAAGRPEQHDNLAGLDLDVDVVEHGVCAECPVDATQ